MYDIQCRIHITFTKTKIKIINGCEEDTRKTQELTTAQHDLTYTVFKTHSEEAVSCQCAVSTSISSLMWTKLRYVTLT
jgi:hypothetical protein